MDQISTCLRNGAKDGLPGQVVLVLQGGGAVGAYQAGVYEALHDAGIEPDWVIGTSIGAINGAIIAGNAPERRLVSLREFWKRVERMNRSAIQPWSWLGSLAGNVDTLLRGVPGFFSPNPAAYWGMLTPIGLNRAAFYSAEDLRSTLSEVIDIERLGSSPHVRITVGAVNVRTGRMHYFDSRSQPIGIAHILGSSALPPALPAVEIEGGSFWDGGIYSNTPIEAVFDDQPRRDSVVFAIQLWPASGPAPNSIWQVLARQKEIQYASRTLSHIARQKQIHQLRHIIRELVGRLPPDQRDTPEIGELTAYGCGTTMHIIELDAPRLNGEDHMRDIDFTTAGITARWEAGYNDAQRTLNRKPWQVEVDPMVGVAVHGPEEAPVS
jgi:NTE family protein